MTVAAVDPRVRRQCLGACVENRPVGGGPADDRRAHGSKVVKLDEEHAYVALLAGDALELGQTVSVVPNHACVVANLFDELVAVRNGEAVARWRVDARGRST